MSYQLSLIERKVGSPEKPISDLGMKGYMSYWTSTLCDALLSQPGDAQLSLEDLSFMTCITVDVRTSLFYLRKEENQVHILISHLGLHGSPEGSKDSDVVQGSMGVF